jgi:adenylate cyclase
MTYRNKRRWRIIRNYSIGWILASIFLSIIRGIGTIQLSYVNVDFWTSILYSVIMGPLFGFISGVGQIFTIEHIYRRMSIQKLLLIRVIYAILFITLIVVLSYLIVGKGFLALNISLQEFAFEPGSFAIYFYLVVIDTFLTILSFINLMLGEGNLGKLLRGQYYHPRDEERIFMFLDLQSSTTLAERLGHIQYSKLLQDCFNDMGEMAEDEAEIYQYVGDGAILTWKIEKGLKNQNCLRAFFRFKHQLIERKDYYQNEYGCEPLFKAGMNAGVVTVTEVGKYKKEIAYHGDTINTAARIQGKCNEFQKDLLISGALVKHLDQSAFTFEKLGSIELRGKGDLVDIFAAFDGN